MDTGCRTSAERVDAAMSAAVEVYSPTSCDEMGLGDLLFVGLAMMQHAGESDRYPSFVALGPAPSPRLIGWVRMLMVTVHTPPSA